MEIKTKISKWDLTKLKNVCIEKEIVSKTTKKIGRKYLQTMKLTINNIQNIL